MLFNTSSQFYVEPGETESDRQLKTSVTEYEPTVEERQVND